MAPTLRQIEQAREQLSLHIFNTPIITNDLLNKALNCTVFWKLENFQHTNSFKVRGALNRCLGLTDYERFRGLVTASSGNHGIGISFGAKAVGTAATIFVPVNTTIVKRDFVRYFGASIIEDGRNYNEALALAENYALKRNLTLISAFDDPLIVAGQGTLAFEILKELGDVDDFVVPIGGGSLAAGVGIVINALKPSVRIYGVQAKAAPSCYESCLLGAQVTTPPTDTLADGLVCTKPGRLTFPIIQKTVYDILLVDESSIADAVKTLFRLVSVVIEPAGAVSLAALTTYRHRFWKRRVACVLTGGNIDPRAMKRILFC